MISAIVLTKDEEKNIGECLESLRWCNEIIVIDDYSKDKTVNKVQKFKRTKVQIFKKKLNGDFSGQRNFGLSKAKGDWVLFVDADEKVSPELRDEILASIKVSSYQSFKVRRIDYWGGRWLRHGEIGQTKLLRLAKKKAGKWQREVHEIWQVNEQAGELIAPLLHYPHQTLTKFLKNLNYYSSLHAKSLKLEGKTSGLIKILIFPTGKFLDNYLVKKGFLDGMPGFIYATMMSIHSFLAWSKLYLLCKKQ